MSLLRKNQDVTVWESAGSDENGTITYLAPVTVKCRWVEKDGVFTNAQGDSQASEFIIYSDTLINKRSMVVLGVETSATPTSDARMIEGIINNPSISTLKRCFG